MGTYFEVPPPMAKRKPTFYQICLALSGACVIAICLHLLQIGRPQDSGFTVGSGSSSSLIHSNSGSKNAFVLFLGDYSNGEDHTDESDPYYIGTRVVLYQLLHDPVTRTNTSIPVVILATRDVAPRRIARLRKDGADVRIVDKVKIPSMGEGGRWQDVMTKLRVFELVEFEKVVLMDSDMVIINRMDGIFDDPATTLVAPKSELEPSDEGPLPPYYMLSAQTINNEREHEYPPAPANYYFSGGFFVCHPSVEIFKYYMRILNIPHRFSTELNEQDMLNYAHRREGPMPWTDFHYLWTTTWPTIREYKKGAHSMHEKWWSDREDLDPLLVERWMQAKFEMMVHSAVQ
ncbi:hypothetical protein MMC28_008960 [Mycoblastus sanguinarius]|nr:hypothetical protein [Mycoblastus sanguinarius]